jgi:hypothetical protein
MVMPSLAYSEHLQQVLADVNELIQAHDRLTTGHRGRQWGVESINRAIVVIAISSWEAYVEKVLEESLQLIKPPLPTITNWQTLYASSKSAIGRFNTPNAENVKRLFRDNLGISDITCEWYWKKCDSSKAIENLNEALLMRHRIAHGTNPRPKIRNDYASWLPKLINNLAMCTDRGIKNYLEKEMGLQGIFI